MCKFYQLDFSVRFEGLYMRNSMWPSCKKGFAIPDETLILSRMWNWYLFFWLESVYFCEFLHYFINKKCVNQVCKETANEKIKQCRIKTLISNPYLIRQSFLKWCYKFLHVTVLLIQKELSRCHKLWIYNPNIFGSQSRKSLIF